MEKYDVFISHAHADKESFVKDLKESFSKLGIKIFYDTDSIEWGDNWESKINEGLDKCRFGVIIISNDFYNRKWTEKELKKLLSRQNKNGENIILPILYNTTCDEMKQHYKGLSTIQFISASKYDIKDITILLARKLLKDNSLNDKFIQNKNKNNIIFDTFFEKMNSIDFFRWIDNLIQNNNSWIDDYDEDVIGWHNLTINGKAISLIQQQRNPSDSNMFYTDTSDYQYRINPIYYKDFCKYFDENIRPQM